MVKRFVALFALMFLASAGVAHAGDGYSDEDSLTVSDSTVAAGDDVVLTAQVCAPGSTATFTLGDTTLGSAVADASGVATLTVTVPTDLAPGTYTVESSCPGLDGETLVLSVTLTVSAGGVTPLPTTGSNSSIPMTQVAIGVIAAGGLLVLLGNKRRSATVKVDANV